MIIVKNINTKTPSYSFESTNNYRFVTKELIDEIVTIGLKENTIVRLLLHQNHSAYLQSMVIFLPHNQGYEMHRHPYKNECYHSVIGEIECEIANKDKSCYNQLILNKDNPIFYSLQGMWHSLKAINNYAVFVEHREGPFIPNDDTETEWYEEKKC